MNTMLSEKHLELSTRRFYSIKLMEKINMRYSMLVKKIQKKILKESAEAQSLPLWRRNKSVKSIYKYQQNRD
jgi:hypothetical protein